MCRSKEDKKRAWPEHIACAAEDVWKIRRPDSFPPGAKKGSVVER